MLKKNKLTDSVEIEKNWNKIDTEYDNKTI